MKGNMMRQIAALDATKDFEIIMYLLQTHEFAWDYERSLEFALFRTYAVPSISTLLCQTGEFIKRPRKRYDDTQLILYEIMEQGFDSERGRAALKRMNQMHTRFRISNDDFLYVLSAFIFEPIRWIERFGWRSLTEQEKHASFYYYQQLGHYMGIKHIPQDRAAFEVFNLNYEREHYHYNDNNYRVGAVTRDLLLGFYLPIFLLPLGRPVIYAMLDDHLREAFGFPNASAPLRYLVQTALRLRGKVLRYFPDRKTPHLGTKVKRPTYPEGYKINELGTFKEKDND
jgi:hypothetical protein